MIKHRHGTLTAPRRDNERQTKRETDRLCLSFRFMSLGHRARLIAVSASLLSNTTQAGVAAGTKPELLPPEGIGRDHESQPIPRFRGRGGEGEVPKGAVRHLKTPSNPAPCQVGSNGQALPLSLLRLVRVAWIRSRETEIEVQPCKGLDGPEPPSGAPSSGLEQGQAQGHDLRGAEARALTSPHQARQEKYEAFGSLNPQFAAAGHRGAATEAVKRLRAFRAQYQRALAKWTAGNRTVSFPKGTWWMRVCHGARCGPEPSPLRLGRDGAPRRGLPAGSRAGLRLGDGGCGARAPRTARRARADTCSGGFSRSSTLARAPSPNLSAPRSQFRRRRPRSDLSLPRNLQRGVWLAGSQRNRIPLTGHKDSTTAAQYSRALRERGPECPDRSKRAMPVSQPRQL